MRRKLANSLQARALACDLNIPLIEFLIKHQGRPDVHLSRDLAKGAKTKGDIKPSRALAKRDTTPPTNLGRLKLNLVARNRNILRHLSRSNATALQRK